MPIVAIIAAFLVILEIAIDGYPASRLAGGWGNDIGHAIWLIIIAGEGMSASVVHGHTLSCSALTLVEYASSRFCPCGIHRCINCVGDGKRVAACRGCSLRRDYSVQCKGMK